MTGITIGKLAQATDVGIETIRFYERRGLIEDPPRRRSGYRQYPPETVGRLRFIRRAKELGFSLDEIGQLLDLRLDPVANRDRVRAQARDKIADIERRIADLTRMKSALFTLADACAHQHDGDACAILDALDGIDLETPA